MDIFQLMSDKKSGVIPHIPQLLQREKATILLNINNQECNIIMIIITELSVNIILGYALTILRKVNTYLLHSQQ
jgi:hypothetical protein